MSELKIIIANKRYSSWSLRGWLAVRHTDLPFEEIMLRLDTPAFYQEIVKYNPAKKVPTLLHANIAVWDSAAIIDYCSRIAPGKHWWPEENAAYAVARSICAEMHSGFTHLRTHMPMNMQGRWRGLSLSSDVENDVRRVEQIWTQCRETLGTNGDFLFGDFSAADMMYAPVVSRFETYDIQLNPVASAYRDAVLAHSDFVEWLSAAEKENEIVTADQIPASATHLG